MSSKLELRRHFRQQRMLIKEPERSLWNAEISRQILTLTEVADARVIFSYVANWGEVETAEIIRTCLNSGQTVLTPMPDHRLLPGDGFHVACAFEDGKVITEPCPGSVRPEDIDVIFVPGIVWDSVGHRIGFGGGYFDRLLAGRRQNAVAVGLSYEMQLVDKVPVEEWDQPVDIVVTETRILRNKG